MEPGQNELPAEGLSPSQAQPATNDFSSNTAEQSAPAVSDRGVLADPTSRRRFLRATVAAGAIVGGVAAAGGVAFAANGPQLLKSFRAGTSTPSGHCVDITEGVHQGNNPNDHVQVSTCDFLTYIGTIDGNASNGDTKKNCDPTNGSGTTFVILHPVAVLVDKNGHFDNTTLCILGASYKAGNTGQISLMVTPFSLTQGGVVTKGDVPSGSCLYVNQTATTC
jgi:hypothetical protein